jgi:acyl-homoserine lactone acylase PvdQ
MSQKSQSYTQYVALKDVDESMALLPIGESEHPEDPYRLSGYELWSQGELRPAPLSRKRVEKYMTSKKLLYCP